MRALYVWFVTWCGAYGRRRAQVALDACSSRPLCPAHAVRYDYWTAYAERCERVRRSLATGY